MVSSFAFYIFSVASKDCTQTVFAIISNPTSLEDVTIYLPRIVTDTKLNQNRRQSQAVDVSQHSK